LNASNVTALNQTNRFVNLGRYTLANLELNISNSIYPLLPCPDTLPLWNGSQCIGCLPTEYYDLKSLKCIHARNVSNLTALNATGRVVVVGQYSLAYLANQINSSLIPVQECPAALPFFDGTQCVACPAGQYYLIETLSCYTPLFSSNVSALNASGRVVEVGNYTLANLNQTIAAQVFPTTPCPTATPLLSAGQCIGCALGLYYNL
jgi:hypothetical protein